MWNTNTRIGDTRLAKSKLNKIFDTTIRSRQFVIVQNHSGQSVIAKKKKKEKRKKASFVKNIQVNFAIFSYDMYILSFFYFSQKGGIDSSRKRTRRGVGASFAGHLNFPWLTFSPFPSFAPTFFRFTFNQSLIRTPLPR